jgi:coenzyme Q-binding protein COQ10
MVIIEVSKLVKQDKNKVYSILKNMEEFPQFMKGVKKLSIIERDDNRLVTHWEVEIDGAIVMWKEEDIFDDKETTINFKMIEGDYKSYGGNWRVEDAPKGAKITIIANFDWGMPVFEELVGNILCRKARKALRSMLNAIKNRLDIMYEVT